MGLNGLDKTDLSKIRTGDLLFLSGTKWMSKQIKKAQKDKGNLYYNLNHVGVFVWLEGNLCVFEEDYPGQLDNNRFKTEYIDTESEVYLGTPVNAKLNNNQIEEFTRVTLDECGEDRFTNYAYLDILTFKVSSLVFKLTGKDTWWGRKKNKKDRYTCSQRTAKYLQDYLDLCTSKPYLEWTPADIADEKSILITKIQY